MPTSSPSSDDLRFGRQALLRLGRSIVSFGTSEVGPQARALGGLLLGLLLAINALNVVNSYVGRDFMTSIEHRDLHGFFVDGVLYVGVFAVLTAVAVFYRYAEERLGLVWREWITRRTVKLYLDDRLYYRLSASGTLTNPDQRIADDVRAFTTTTLSLTLIFLNAAFTLIAFSGVLWSISRLLFVVAVLYASLGSLLAVYLGRPLVRLNYDQADKEANFRADLVHIRENTESVALLHREDHMRGRLLERVDAFVDNFRRIIAVNRNLGFFTTGYNYLIPLVPVLIVAPLFIAGSAEFGVLSQSSMAFAHVLGAFSVIVTQFPSLSTYAAVLARLSPIVGAAETTTVDTGGIEIVEDASRFAFEALTLRSPHDGEVVVDALSVEVRPRRSLFVTAANDIVLNALPRAIAGIWTAGQGRVVRPSLETVVVLPDRPYLPPGSLAEVLRSASGAPVSADAILEALAVVGIDHAVERVGGLDIERDWDDLLSLEEQRLVSLARLLVAVPKFAVIAHLGEGLGADGARRMVDLLSAKGIGTLVLEDGIVRPGDFDAVLEVAADGTWKETARAEGGR